MSATTLETEQNKTSIIPVDELQNHGINVSDITKLKSAGIFSIQSVLSTTKRNLVKIKGLSEAKVDKIKESAGKIIFIGFIPGQGN